MSASKAYRRLQPTAAGRCSRFSVRHAAVAEHTARVAQQCLHAILVLIRITIRIEEFLKVFNIAGYGQV